MQNVFLQKHNQSIPWRSCNLIYNRTSVFSSHKFLASTDLVCWGVGCDLAWPISSSARWRGHASWQRGHTSGTRAYKRSFEGSSALHRSSQYLQSKPVVSTLKHSWLSPYENPKKIKKDPLSSLGSSVSPRTRSVTLLALFCSVPNLLTNFLLCLDGFRVYIQGALQCESCFFYLYICTYIISLLDYITFYDNERHLPFSLFLITLTFSSHECETQPIRSGPRAKKALMCQKHGIV